jgi:hypothetical protein
MATNNIGHDVTLIASADLSAQQFRIVKLTSTGVAVANATDLNQVGVLQDKPAALGIACNVRWNGVSKVRYGGNVAIGDRLTSDANGAAVVATTGKQVVGIATAAGVSGDVGSILVQMRGVA